MAPRRIIQTFLDPKEEQRLRNFGKFKTPPKAFFEEEDKQKFLKKAWKKVKDQKGPYGHVGKKRVLMKKVLGPSPKPKSGTLASLAEDKIHMMSLEELKRRSKKMKPKVEWKFTPPKRV